MNHDTVADDTGLVLIVYLTLGNQTTGHCADLGDLEYLLHFNLTRDNLLLHLVEHTLHRRLHLVDGIIDD